MSLTESIRKAAEKEKKNKGVVGLPSSNTTPATKESNTTNRTSSLTDAIRKAAEKEAKSRTVSSSAPPQGEACPKHGITTAPAAENNDKDSSPAVPFGPAYVHDYSSAVKYLQDIGAEGASGIMTEREWQRSNKKDGSYQAYVRRMASEEPSPMVKALQKTTITSDLSDDERKARISEINSEISKLQDQRNGLSRAAMYGNVGDLIKQNEARQAELLEEKKKLERVGTFSQSEMLQWEIDDKKAEKTSAFTPAGRVTPDQAEAIRKDIAIDNEIKDLEREKEMYEDIEKFGNVVNDDDFGGQWRANYRSNELSREADKAMNIYLDNPTEENRQIAYAYDALAKEYAKNNEKALDDENVKASWLTKTAAGYLPQLKDQLLPELVGGGLGLLVGSAVGAPNVGASIGSGIATFPQVYGVTRGSVYRTLISEGVDEETARSAANDEALISALIESGETALSWLLMGGGKALSAIGTAAKTSVAKGSTNAAVKAVANLAGKASARATTKAASKAAAEAARPFWSKAIRTGVRVALQPVTEYAEEFSQGAVSMANREKALATVEKEVGQFGRGNVDLYNRPIYKNADGSISTVESVTYKVGDKYVLLPSIVRGENGTAKRLETDEEIFAHYEKTGEYLGEFDTLEEANAYAIKLHSAQDYYYSDKTVSPDDSLLRGGAKVIGSALSGNNPEAWDELHAQGVEGYKIGLMFGGSQTIVNGVISNYANKKTVAEKTRYAESIAKDEETLKVLVNDGKSMGEGSVSAKIATEIETTIRSGKEVTTNQVKRLIESNKVYTKVEEQTAPTTLEEAAQGAVDRKNKADGYTLLENWRRGRMDASTLDALTENGVEITADNVKKVTGFGDEGAKLVAHYANADGATFSKVMEEVKSSYLTGFDNPDLDVKKGKGAFVSPAQVDAYTAGQMDRIMDLRKNAVNATQAKGKKDSHLETKDGAAVKAVFENTGKLIIGADVISDGKIAIPRTEESLATAQAATKSVPTEDGTFTMDKLYNGENNVVIAGTPRAMEKNGVKQYVFEVDGKLYACRKAHYDAFGGNGNIIRAGANESTPWTVHTPNGDLAAVMMPLTTAGITQAEFEKMPALERQAEAIHYSFDDESNLDNENGKEQARSEEAEKIFKAPQSTLDKLSEQIDRWLSGQMAGSDTFEFGGTPEVLRQIGANSLPVTMSQNVMVKLSGGKHSIALDEIRNLPQAIADPIMIFKSATVDNAFVILTELTDKNGDSVVVALHLNKLENRMHINRIASVYGKQNAGGFVEKQIKDGNLKYFDKKRASNWATSRGLQLPKLVQSVAYSTNIILEKEDIVNIYFAQKSKKDANLKDVKNGDIAKSSLEGSTNNEGRSLLSDGSGQRTDSARAGEQTGIVAESTGGYQEGRKTAGERRKRAEALRADGLTHKEKISSGESEIQAEVIDEAGYNDEMRGIVEENKKRGVSKTIIITGNAKISKGKGAGRKTKSARGVFIRRANGETIVVVRYDHALYTPQQLNRHELAHMDYQTDTVQKAKKVILNSLSVSQRVAAVRKLRRDYAGMLEGMEDGAVEELVCNILAGMSEYSQNFSDMSATYWNGEETALDSFKVSEYTESIDAGGASNVQERTDSRRVAEISKGTSNKGTGDRGNSRNLSVGDAAVEGEADDRSANRGRNVSEGSGLYNMEESTKSSKGKDEPDGQEADGARFLEAINSGDKETARKLLDVQAIRNGFEPVSLYHGTHAAIPFKSFNGKAAIWVTENKQYATDYVTDYADATSLGEQLFTSPNSGVFELYVKKGKSLDLGNIDKDIESPADLFALAERIGFSKEEIIRCWNAGRHYEDNSIWTLSITPEFADIARKYGYDSLRATEAGRVKTFGILHPKNVKSAKLLTYDDAGDIIPLEKRFSEDTDLRFSLDDDGEFDLVDIWNQRIEEFGAIPKGEKPAREIKVPKKIAKDKPVIQTVRTILEAKTTPEETLPTIEKMVLDGVFSYDAYTDKQAIKDADAHIKEYGWDESLDAWFNDVEKGVVSKQHTAMGWALYNNAANIAATTTSETEKTTAIKTSLKILDAMARHQRSAAQALQATRILKKLSPETQLYGVAKSVQAFQTELTDKYGKKAPDLKINEKLAEEFLNAETEEERAEIEKEIYKDIGRQMPSRFIDKWNAWRYLAMLGNVRTHTRNIVGNAFFAPVVLAKNLTATAIESAVNRVSPKKIVRGKALITGSKADKALLKAAWSDYGNVSDIISNGGKYNDSAMANRHIEEGRRIFKTKPLEWARKKNSALLEKEDMWFSKPHYAYALAQYCKANNITAEQIKRGKAIAPAREYAIKEAQKATYRDTNAFSQFVSSLGRGGEIEHVPKVVSMAVEGVLPFRKTPANILVRGVEYSPIGLLKGLTYDLEQVQKGKMEAHEAIDNISAGLTGTGLLALGVFLAAQGLIRGHGEEDKDEKAFKEMMGHQSYALELPNGQSITLDWLAPEALPFFVGVNIWEATKGAKEEVNLSTVLKAVSSISEPMLEMSCLQSLNDLSESVGYATSNDTSGLVTILSSAATSYLTQGIPTLLGQAERTGEENRMTTYTEKNAFLTSDMQYTLGKASAKIPFWDYQQIPYIDAWGRKEASGTALKRGFNNFLNPAYTSTVEESKMEKELLRLFEKTGESSVFPKRADKYFTVDGKRKDLTADEYVRYATLKGEKSHSAVTSLVNSNAYKKLTDSEKVEAIEDAYDYANQKAKKAISSGYKTDTWVSTADAFGTNVGNFLSFRSEVSNTKQESGGKLSKQDVVDIVIDMAQNDSEAWKMYLSMYDSTSDAYAYDNGIDGGTYMSFLESLNDVDTPTDSGKYGTYTQKEATNAINQLEGLSRDEKAVLWQSVNQNWKAKNNPFR